MSATLEMQWPYRQIQDEVQMQPTRQTHKLGATDPPPSPPRHSSGIAAIYMTAIYPTNLLHTALPKAAAPAAALQRLEAMPVVSRPSNCAPSENVCGTEPRYQPASQRVSSYPGKTCHCQHDDIEAQAEGPDWQYGYCERKFRQARSTTVSGPGQPTRYALCHRSQNPTLRQTAPDKR